MWFQFIVNEQQRPWHRGEFCVIVNCNFKQLLIVLLVFFVVKGNFKFSICVTSSDVLIYA